MADKRKTAENLSNYLTVGEAAELLGVSPSTLRHWDRTGKLKAWRHPDSGHRLYEKTKIRGISKFEKFLSQIQPSRMGQRRFQG